MTKRKINTLIWFIFFAVSCKIFYDFSSTSHLFDTFSGRLNFSDVLAKFIYAQIIVGVILFYKEVAQLLINFFTTATHPINLSLFRIVLFYMIIHFNPQKALFYSQFPKELMFIPYGLNWILSWLPVNATVVHYCAFLLKFFSITALIGFRTRLSIFICVIALLYLNGIPQLYGKINHYHHTLWFMMILSFSRCADVFSIDALINAFKKADQGNIKRINPSIAYALPIRFIWILIGILYFFAGYWKWKVSGIDWIFSQNLAYRLYFKWIEFPGWLPLFRIDQYPDLYQFSAGFTVFFEKIFIFLIFFPTLRYLAVIFGLSFHTMTFIFMKIGFRSLVKCYVIFFDWHDIFKKVGKFIFKKDLFVIFDGNCQFCRRIISAWNVFNIFEREKFINAHNERALYRHKLNWLNPKDLKNDFHAVIGKNVYKGFKAYRVLCQRNPLFWPILPLFYCWPVPYVAERIYTKIVASRSCDQNLSQKKIKERSKLASLPDKILIVVGILLIFGNIYFGYKNIHSWPLSVYPTFANAFKDHYVQKIDIRIINMHNEEIPFSNFPISRKFAPERFAGLMESIERIEDPNEKDYKLHKLWRFLRNQDEDIQKAKGVRFYQALHDIIPEHQHKNLIEQSLLLELKSKE